MAGLQKSLNGKIGDQTRIDTAGDIAAGRRPLIFQPDQYIKIILKSMQKNRSGCAGVLHENGRLIGMLTEREILRRIFSLLADPTIHQANIGKYVDDMAVCDVMIAQPQVLYDDMDIEEALDVMTERGFRFMPVVSRLDPASLTGFVDEREVAIHVKNRLDRVKREAAEKDQFLHGLFCEPYGRGYSLPASSS